ncbi:13030_t:CDS:2 [Rhizophagus irregularis]|nr:13030_t:CDS:2 [Rhizophagus irregularis]
MSHIELHLAFFNDSGPTPMQEDPSVTHVLVNLHFSDPPSRWSYNFAISYKTFCEFSAFSSEIPGSSNTDTVET